MVSVLAEIEQFYREQDQRMSMLYEDSGDESAEVAKDTHPSQLAQVQNVSTADHVTSTGLNPTADPAAFLSATDHVRLGGHFKTNPRNMGTASSGLKRKHPEGDSDIDSTGIHKHEHQNLQPREHANVSVYPSDLHVNVPQSGPRETPDAAASFDVIGVSKTPTIQPKTDQATIESIIPVASGSKPDSGPHKSQSIASKRQRVTNSADRTGPVRDDRKTPRPVSAVSDIQGHAPEIIDLTLDFVPQLTSTQVAASPPRKARTRTEEKEKVSTHATSSPRRDKPIKATPAAEVPTLSKNPPLTPAPFLVIDIPADHPEHYSSNVTTPANTNPFDRAPIFSLTSIIDATSESTSRRSRRDPKPKATKPTKGKKKEKPALVTPLEYARKLQESIQTMGQKQSKRYPKYLRGKRIFYVGGDMQYAGERTRNRMEFIVKHGGTLLPTYDASEVTHIVTDAPEKTTLRALGLRSLKEIPDHVPTVTWTWVPSGLGAVSTTSGAEGGTEMEVEMDDDAWMHAAFHERIDVGVRYGSSRVKGKGKGKDKAAVPIAATTEEISHISEFTQEAPRGGSHRVNPSPVESSSKSSILAPTPVVAAAATLTDPLAEFYPMAKAEAEAETAWSTYGVGDSEDEMSEGEEVALPSELQPHAQASKRGFTCDDKEIRSRYCPNQDVVDKLQELMELHKAKPSEDDRWRAFSYGKCLRGLRNHPTRITSYAEARSIRGVGDKTAMKIMEILQTGNLRRIRYERTEDVEAYKVFQGIYGVGQTTAFKWYACGCRNLDDVKAHKGGIKLSAVQELGVRYYEDINDRMPRAEAEAIFQHIRPLALAIDPKLSIDIMGSFRRGKADCGDIDILITRPVNDGKNHVGVLRTLIRQLHEIELLTEDLSLPEDWDDLEGTYRGLCKLPHEGKRRRRIDILAVPWQSRGAALLYYTGDDIFNRAMRFKAGTMGYSLNQRGLYGGVVRDPRDRKKKLNTGTIVASETEEEIFRILGVPWQEPHDRVRG